jgi:hypothetical protein
MDPIMHMCSISASFLVEKTWWNNLRTELRGVVL